jgi:heme-degrading monooxygenase HmoA
VISILARVTIEELPQFLAVFATRGAEMRRSHGSRRAQIFRVSDEEKQVVVLFDWESRASFDGFLSDPAVRTTMASSGTVGRPEFTFLEPVADLPG